MENLSNQAAKFPHNATLTPHVVPMLQGLSNPDVCWDLCKHGFAQLSGFDEGYYGKGMYFTSNVEYAVNIFSRLDNRVVLVSFVNIGNPYPCIENPNTPRESLIGRNIKQGYDSHYAVVDGSGLPLEKSQVMNLANSDKRAYDEMVIGEEQQILPCYLVFLGRGKRPTLSRAKVEMTDDMKKELETAREEDYKEEEFRTKSFQIEREKRPANVPPPSILKNNYYNPNFKGNYNSNLNSSTGSNSRLPPPMLNTALPPPPALDSSPSVSRSSFDTGRRLPTVPQKNRSGPPTPMNLSLNLDTEELNPDYSNNNNDNYEDRPNTFQLEEVNY